MRASHPLEGPHIIIDEAFCIMHVLYITNHFSLPNQPGAPRPWQVALYFAKNGHDVTVLTNRSHYLDESISIADETIHNKTTDNRIEIVSIQTTKGRRRSLFGRVVNYLSFALNVFFCGVKLRAVDLVIAGTPPILAPISGILIGKIHNAFTALEIRDFHPEKARAIQVIKSKWIYKVWGGYEYIIRRLYNHLVAVEPSTQKRLLQQGFKPERITVIPNGIDIEHTQPCELPNKIEDKFVQYEGWNIITYGGGLGIGNFLQPIFEAADFCRDEPVVFFIFGEGEMKNKYSAFVKKKKLNNVCFFPLQTRQIINEVFRRSTVLIYSVRKNPFFNGLMTNKIFEYLASGRPIILSGKGDMAKIITDARAGICVDPEDPYKIDQAIRFLVKNPASGNRMGQDGKSYVLRYHLRNKTFNEWQKIINVINH